MTTRARCQCKPTCRFKPTDGSEFYLLHDARPEMAAARSAEAARRGRSGQKRRAEAEAATARTARKSVPLSTPAQVREYLETLAATVENSKGNAVEKVNAAVRVATAAAQLLKDELEKQALEIQSLIERYGQLQNEVEQ